MKGFVAVCVGAAIAGFLIGGGVQSRRTHTGVDHGADRARTAPPPMRTPRARIAPDQRPTRNTLPSPAHDDDLLGLMRADDPLAATVASNAIDIAFNRLLERAWRTHEHDGVEPNECLGGGDKRETVSLRLRLRSAPDRLVLEDARIFDADLTDAARACLSTYFGEAAEVRDIEVGGPLPALDVDVELAVPVVLGEYFAVDP